MLLPLNLTKNVKSRILIVLACLFVISGCTKLGALNALLPKDTQTSRILQAVPFGSHPRQKLDVYLPESSKEGRPVVVFLYGGSWNSGRRQDYAFAGHALNSKGYIAVIPDYRLVPEVRYPVFLQDNVAALQWVKQNIAKWAGDASQVYLVGHSAGAYNAVMLSVDSQWTRNIQPDIPKIAGVVGLAGPYDFLPLKAKTTRAAFVGIEDLSATQPVNLVNKNSAPMLLLTGDQDKLVLPGNSRSLFESAKQTGAPVQFKTYADIGHVKLLLSLSRPLRKSAPTLKDIDLFFKEIGRQTDDDELSGQ